MLPKTTKLFLEQILQDKNLHGRWLNTLSFLEYIGTRKILKSLSAPLFNQVLLSHTVEEAYHSLFFKKLSQKVCGKDLSFKKEEMIGAQECETYFQSLDKKSLELAKGHVFLNYLYTTWIVEIRALKVYSIYNDLLKQKKQGFSLQSILKDEKEHLQEVETQIKKQDKNHPAHLNLLQDFEKEKFEELLQHLNKEIQISKPSLLSHTT